MDAELVLMFVGAIGASAGSLLSQYLGHHRSLEKIRTLTAQIEVETAALKQEANRLMGFSVTVESTRLRSGAELGIYNAREIGE